jgi:hypothetical protein
MLHLARAHISPLSLRAIVPAARAIHIKAPGFGSPESEGPLYSHASAASAVYGIHSPNPEADATAKESKKRDPKGKNHKVTGGNNFNELKRMHNVSSDSGKVWE